MKFGGIIMRVNKVKVLVTGATGQLGMELMGLLQSDTRYEYYGFGRKSLDVTDLVMVKRVFSDIKPHIIIHLAAYTAVDKAEKNPEEAFLVNGYGGRNVAVATQSIGSKLIYVSTDYVFNGDKHSPYNEFDFTSPTSIYGKSKLAGELFVRDLCLRYFIVRTSWLYGNHGMNFVKKILSLTKEKDELSVVSDQIGSPTYTSDLCEYLIELMETEKYGTYHISNTGHCSWYDFAKKINELSGSYVKLHACKTDPIVYPAPRPAYSVFEHQGLKLNGFTEPRRWEEALKEFMHGYIG